MKETKTELLKSAKAEAATEALTVQKGSSIFADVASFEAAQRMVKPLVQSNLIPDTFRGNIGDCLIALEYSQRLNASPMMVMQNLYVVHGKPAWSSQFLIACINKSGRFSPLRYTMTGEKGTDSFGCIAWAYDSTGEKLESPEITVGIAKKEGWYGKNGSKWQTMPELMLRYRTATLFARLFAPELTMGIQTEEEVRDVYTTQNKPTGTVSKFESAPVVDAEEVCAEVSDIDTVQKALDEKGIPLSAEDVKAFVESKGDIFSAELVIPMIDTLAGKMLENE